MSAHAAPPATHQPHHMTHTSGICIVAHMTETPSTCSDLCDSDAGYQRHRWYDEEPCTRSKAAHAAHNARRRHQLHPPTPRKLADHGTAACYERERRAHKADPKKNPKPCEVCTLGNSARTAAARAKAAG